MREKKIKMLCLDVHLLSNECGNFFFIYARCGLLYYDCYHYFSKIFLCEGVKIEPDTHNILSDCVCGTYC